MSEVALFIVIAMIYVTLARGRLIGSSVMIHEAQYPRVFAIVKRACAALNVPMPLIFVREDYNVPVAALGFGEPYALVLSSHWIEHFEDDELAFIVGRQLGHIAAGHTRFISLLSVNGNENPIISLIFGGWLRTCEFTCDKVGLLVCGSLEAATRAIAVSSFHHFGRQVDVQQFAQQGQEISRDSVLKWGEWLGAEPYAIRRIAQMAAFIKTEKFAALEEWFLREAQAEPPALAAPGHQQVQRGDCANWWRRATAVFIDVVIVGALLGAFTGHETTPVQTTTTTTVHNGTKTVQVTKDTDDSDDAFHIGAVKVGFGGISLGQDNSFGSKALNFLAGYLGSSDSGKPSGTPFWLVALYLTLLVGIAGQSFGMMIAGLRIVTTDFRPPGFWRTLWRYVVALMLWMPILFLSPFMRRIMLHDRWSGTRLITSERVLARALTTPA